ncbi:hypothetical protein [Streptomyces luteolus]|uniref:Uncharacterized protein n=1 Tax=Streptomyces luteolus TaxID=3043615 RepID=A0ABT6SWG5_9ACTN|nr:hypothetical protein [Streptomyces sp. B-S-A12]MDI3419943.1 hypothetical protein [Streptomyces sp. B-S-A12]
MQFVGFFCEIEPDNPDVYSAPISLALAGADGYPAEEMARYLESGHPIFDVMEGTRDVVGDLFHSPGGSSLLTDGRFVWRVDLASYVKHYCLGLSDEFLNHAAGHSYQVPDVPFRQLLEISVSAAGRLGYR